MISSTGIFPAVLIFKIFRAGFQCHLSSLYKGSCIPSVKRWKLIWPFSTPSKGQVSFLHISQLLRSLLRIFGAISSAISIFVISLAIPAFPTFTIFPTITIFKNFRHFLFLWLPKPKFPYTTEDAVICRYCQNCLKFPYPAYYSSVDHCIFGWKLLLCG